MTKPEKEDKKLCGRCNFCMKDDGAPYCVMKDLYTTVKLNDECDERDYLGRLWFSPEKVKESK